MTYRPQPQVVGGPAFAFGVDTPCQDEDPELFFPPAGVSPRRAKEICRSGCPVLDNCLGWALAAPETLGVWGGTSAPERAALRSGQPLTRACADCGATLERAGSGRPPTYCLPCATDRGLTRAAPAHRAGAR